MPSKEQLRRVIDELTDAEAADALDYLARRHGAGRDPLGEMLDQAPRDDEPTSPKEDEAARAAHNQIAQGEVFSAEQIKREIT